MAKLTLNWPAARYRRKKIPIPPPPTVVLLGTSPVTGPLHRRHHQRREAALRRCKSYWVFKREGAALEKPVHECAALYERLIKEQPEDFLSKFGLLWTRNKTEMTARAFNECRREIRKLVAAKERDDWDVAKKWMEERPSVIEFDGIIGEDEAGRPQLEYKPRHLFGFIVAQLIQDWSGGKEYKFCKNPGCGEYFYYGPGTDHRETAQYHSKKCNLAHAYQIRKEQSK